MPLFFLGKHAGRPARHLHKEEMIALLIWTGRKAGMTVRTEVPAGNGRIDVGWYGPGNELLTVFEVDGRDVHGYPGTLIANTQKFTAMAAPYNVQVLYSLRNNLLPKPTQPQDPSLVAAKLPPGTRVVLDEDLPTDVQGADADLAALDIRREFRPADYMDRAPAQRTEIDRRLGLLGEGGIPCL